MATTQKYLLLTQTNLLSTGLNALANNTAALSSTFDNTQAATGDGSLLCDVEIVVTYGTAPSANTGCSLWFLQTQDGTNFEDGGTSVTPSRLPDLVFPLRAVATAQRIIRRAYLPQGKFQALLKNDGTGQAMGATGNLLNIRPVTVQSV